MFSGIDIKNFQPILSIFTGILIAFVSSWITVRLSMKKFRTEWLWERKADCYVSIIEALHNAKAFNIAHMHYYETGNDLPENRDKELRLRSQQGHDAIRKAIDMGSFLLSQKALDRLTQYHKETTAIAAIPDEGWYGYLDKDLDAIQRCLKDIIEITKQDLKTQDIMRSGSGNSDRSISENLALKRPMNYGQRKEQEDEKDKT